MSFRVGDLRLHIGYEPVAALTAAMLLDKENTVVFCILAAVLHELGHIVMMKALKVRLRAVSLRLFDVLMEADPPGSLAADVLITLGGPMSNFLFALLCAVLGMRLWMPHLVLGIFNLLPVEGLDGGHLLYIVLSRLLPPRPCEMISKILSFVFILPFLTAGIYILIRTRYNYTLLFVSLYLMAVLLLR